MALELKGLKGKAIKARANLDALNAAYDKFNLDATTHANDVAALTTDLEEMQSDLQFATATLGNSVTSSNAGAEKVVIAPADVGKIDASLAGGSGASTEPSQTSGATVLAQPAA